MVDFIVQGLAISLVELSDALEALRFLCHKGTLPKKRKDVIETIVLGVLVNVPKKIILREGGKWVFDSANS